MPYYFTPATKPSPLRTFYDSTRAPMTLPAPGGPPQATLTDIAAQLVRMETRMVKLMYHVGLDASGRVREEN